MKNLTVSPRRRARVITHLQLLVMVLISSAFVLTSSPPPASAAATHTFKVTGTVDIKDDDVGDDDWCYNKPISKSLQMDHGASRTRVLVPTYVRCDEVWVSVTVKGELMTNEKICNIVLDVKLYEGQSSDTVPDDLDGSLQWKGGTDWCIARGGWLKWDVLRVDNFEPYANDHGWVKNLVIRHDA